MPRGAHALSLLFVSVLLLAAQAAAPTPASQNASPNKPVVEPSPDPASVHFLSDAGLLLVAIKPTAVADYEEVIRTLQEAMAKDDRQGTRDGREGLARLQGHRERREG